MSLLHLNVGNVNVKCIYTYSTTIWLTVKLIFQQLSLEIKALSHDNPGEPANRTRKQSLAIFWIFIGPWFVAGTLLLSPVSV